MQIEVIEKLKNSERSLLVEQTENDLVNFYLNKKKEQFEIEMMVFKEQELRELLQKQEEIYKRLEKMKESLSVIDKLKNIIEKITSTNKCN